MFPFSRPQVHVEVLLKREAQSSEELKAQFMALVEQIDFFYNGPIPIPSSMKSVVEEIKIVDLSSPVFFSELPVLNLHVFTLNEDESEEVVLSDDNESTKVCKIHVLPHVHFHGLWESLLFDSSIKSDLLHFLETSMLFSKKRVCMNTITWNKLMLMYGPAGTGKTSLCKGLAQKIIVRFSDVFSYAHLVEISAHSLFSKWFSESGKLVKGVFDKIFELVEDDEAIVFVLIDEVESLAVTRTKAISGGEPSDSIRAVNAFLTQLDQLKHYENVIVLSTSNLEKSVDNAFADRADIKQFVGLPSESVVYMILKDCLKELMQKGIIDPNTVKEIREYGEIEIMQRIGMSDVDKESRVLLELCRGCKGMSGRSIRKLPFLAHVYFLSDGCVPFFKYIEALACTVKKIEENKNKMFLI